MPHRSAETATYPDEMARFEIELPGDLLVLIENLAHEAGETREDLLRRTTEEGLAWAKDAARERIEERLGPPRPMGGESARIIREMRDNWPPLNSGGANDE
jgi:hypothetical protein